MSNINQYYILDELKLLKEAFGERKLRDCNGCTEKSSIKEDHTCQETNNDKRLLIETAVELYFDGRIHLEVYEYFYLFTNEILETIKGIQLKTF